MSISTVTLPNGLRIVTDTMRDVESIALGVWVGVGTRHEDLHQNGIAHMVEHMMFKGTSQRSALDISQVIEEAGGHSNAYTGREVTAYYIHILKDHTDLALDVLADMMQNPAFPEDELARERDVIVQEVRMYEDTPDDLVFDNAQEAAYPGQALGAPGLGKIPILESITRDDLFSYVRRNYTPERIVISAAGNVDADEFAVKVAKAFDHLPANTGLSQPYGFAPAHYNPSPSLVAKDTEQTHLLLGFRGLDRHHAQRQAMQLMSNILGGGTSSRLWQEVREKRGMVYSIHSYTDSYCDDGQFGIYAGTSPDNLPEMVPIILGECSKILSGVSERELLRAKTQLISGVRMGREKVMTRADQQGRYLLNYGETFDPAALFEKINAVTCTDIRAIATQIFSSPLLVAAIGPLDTLIPVEEMKPLLRAAS
ncbi:MAG: pitrilysin family protein [Pseudobdellovibrionaceae bacterium]